MSTVAPPFSSASTTCSWPSWLANIIGVHPSWSGTITGAHSDEEHELLLFKQWPIASQKCAPQNHSCYFYSQLRVTVSNNSDYHDLKTKLLTQWKLVTQSVVPIISFISWIVETMRSTVTRYMSKPEVTSCTQWYALSSHTMFHFLQGYSKVFRGGAAKVMHISLQHVGGLDRGEWCPVTQSNGIETLKIEYVLYHTQALLKYSDHPRIAPGWGHVESTPSIPSCQSILRSWDALTIHERYQDDQWYVQPTPPSFLRVSQDPETLWLPQESTWLGTCPLPV